MTPIVRAALEGITDPDVKIVFAKGTYRFRPDYAVNKYCTITNHGNGLKRIAFPFVGLTSIEIEGNGAEFIFHGQMAPFQFERCGQITVKDLKVDWDIPFLFQGEVVAVDPAKEWHDLKPYTEGFSWQVRGGRLEFPDVDGFNYAFLGSTLAFDPQTKRVAHGAWDFESNPRWVEKRSGGILRIHEPVKRTLEIGTVLTSKGEREQDRYAPAFQIKSSRNIHIDRVVVHHALGMGFLFERSEKITIGNSGVYLRDGSKRMVSATADATHFANCKGEILVENCRFENMLDDGTNVHGTYVTVDKVVDSQTVRVRFEHFEQTGFEFAGAGDVLWLIQRPSPQRGTENEVTSVRIINERYAELRLRHPLPAGFAAGDILENKTWNPSFTMRGCTIRNHRARSVVLKTPLKTVIENNRFSSMMSAIFFRGETFFWFESGAVEDVLIRHNHFEYCAYSGMEHAVLFVTPRLGAAFDQHVSFDRNIRFVDNTIETFDNRIVWADRVDGLIITGNKITQTRDAKPLYPNAPLFEFGNCRNVEISGNTYTGGAANGIVADQLTKTTLRTDANQGFR